MIEDPAQLVIPDFADIRGRTAQVGEIRDRVGNRSTRHLGGRAHHVVDVLGTFLVDQRHRPGLRADPVEKLVVDVRQDIDNGVADTEKLNRVRHGKMIRQCDWQVESGCNNTRMPCPCPHNWSRLGSGRILMDMAIPRISRYLSIR